MSRRPTTRPQPTILLTVLIFICEIAGTPAVGPPQQSARPADRAASPASSEEPPVITFDADGLGVLEAVQLALDHDPNIHLAGEDVRRREGEAQEQRGPFDLTLNAVASYEYRVQELTEARKEDEVERRTDLQEFIDDNTAGQRDARVLLERLRAVRNAPGSEQVQTISEIDSNLGTSLQVLDALIAVSAPRERAELLRIRNDLIDETSTQLRRGLQERIEDFDAAEQKLRDLGEAPIDEVSYDAQVRFELSRLFRMGITVAPFIDGTMEGNNFKGKPRSDEFGGKGLEDTFTFRAGANLLVPLGRGRGAAATAAGERAAGAQVDASRLAFSHERAVTALTAIEAYWNLRAAQDSVDIATRSVTLHDEMLTATQALVTGGELAKIEEARVRAGAARASARLKEAQRTLHEARVGLAMVLGLSTTGDDATLPRAKDAFPRLPDPTVLQGWLRQVPGEPLQQRQDLAAATKREEAGAILERGAATNLRPRLDLAASTWYTALAERRVSDAIDRWIGPSASFQVDLEKPLGNNAAKGQLAAREAERRQLQITARDTQRLIKLGVVRTAQSLAETLARVREAEAAVKAYATTITGEVDRFRAGEATLIDTLLTEQQRTDAELAYVAARQDAARLVAQLRFETATLVPADRPPALDTLVTVPARGDGSLP